MAWIKVHQELFRHRKTVALAAALGVSRITAAGHMISLWMWALDNTPDGDLSAIPSAVIAFGAEWTEDPEMFLKAIINAGFLDGDEPLRIHDWIEYAGQLINERKRRASHAKDIRDRHVTVTAPSRVTSQSRVEKTRVEPPTGGTPPVKRPKEISDLDPAFLERMHVRFDPMFGPESVEERLHEAMNNKAANKWSKPELGLTGWLRRDAERLPRNYRPPAPDNNHDEAQDILNHQDPVWRAAQGMN